MRRTLALSFLFFTLMSCNLLEEGSTPDPDPEPQNSAPTVTLNASTLSGVAPLSVTFTATATDPDGDTLSYKWSLAGAADAPTVSQTFSEAGSYLVSVTVSDGQLEASANVNVDVTGDDTEPNPDPDPYPEPNITLSVTASPGGPVPWGVTYKVETSGKVPAGSTLSVTCAGQPAVNLGALEDFEVEDVFSCIHLATGEQVVASLEAKSGKVLVQEEQTADVQPTADTPFGGGWEYTGTFGDAFGEAATFSITQAINPTTGQGEGNYDFEGDVQPGTFTLSAQGNQLTLASDVDAEPAGGLPQLDRVLIFVGDYANRRGVPARKQVFFAPNTQESDSNEGYLYTAQ